MEIINIDYYLDGGTTSITVKSVEKIIVYCIDKRIRTKTKGFIYLGYPNKDNSNIVKNQEFIKSVLIELLKKYPGKHSASALSSLGYKIEI